jgi:tRNA G46 methylase TrmB
MVGSIKNMRGKCFIEVGCGRGGCFNYVTKEFKPDLAIGIDISKENIKFCQ